MVTTSTNKGVNWCAKDITQTQQQKPESPTITLTWHASNYKVQYIRDPNNSALVIHYNSTFVPCNIYDDYICKFCGLSW